MIESDRRRAAPSWIGRSLLFVAVVLLQLEQTALLLGSMLLFAVIAAMMVAPRRIDWYALFARMRSDATSVEPAAS